MAGFSTVRRFWSTFKMVSLDKAPMPSGKDSKKFCDRCKSVIETRLPMSDGKNSRRFSDTSKQAKLDSWHSSLGRCDSWLWSSHSSVNAGKLPMWGGCKDEIIDHTNSCNKFRWYRVSPKFLYRYRPDLVALVWSVETWTREGYATDSLAIPRFAGCLNCWNKKKS